MKTNVPPTAATGGLHRTAIEIATPAGFRLQPTIRGHGWYDLPPFELTNGGALVFFHLVGDEVIELEVREGEGPQRVALTLIPCYRTS